MDVPVNTFMTLKEGEAMSVEQVPNPEVPGAVLANGGNGGGGGGGGSSNSNSHNHTAAVSVQDIREIVAQLARTLPEIEQGSGPPR